MRALPRGALISPLFIGFRKEFLLAMEMHLTAVPHQSTDPRSIMKFRTLGPCILALAAFTSTAAHADTFTFSFEGLLFSGSGTFTGSEVGTTDIYDITSVTGSVTSGGKTSDINKLLGDNKFEGNDNELIYPGTGIFDEKFFDSDGISFSLDNGNDVNLNDTWGFENAVAGPREESTFQSP